MKRYIIVFLSILLLSYCAFSIPHINGISPNSGLIGTTVTIKGTNFGESDGKHSVYFGGVTVPAENIQSWEDNEIILNVPEGAESGDVYVKVNGLESNHLYFKVVEFSPVPQDLIAAVVTDNPGTLSYIRTDPDKGFYKYPELFKLKEGNNNIHPSFVKILDEEPFTIISGWYDDNGSDVFVLKGYSDYTSEESKSLLTDGLIIDAVDHDGIIYACDYQGRSIDKINIKTWEVEGQFALTIDSPYEYPWRIFYSNDNSTVVLVTRSVWSGESGNIRLYDLYGNEYKTLSMPSMKLYDVELVSDSLYLYGWVDDIPEIKAYPLFVSTETLYSKYVTGDDGLIDVGGFKLAPDGKSVLISDVQNNNIVLFGMEKNVIDTTNIIEYGGAVSSPSAIDSIYGIPYILVKSSEGISIVDTDAQAFYGTLDFKGDITDFDYNFYEEK